MSIVMKSKMTAAALTVCSVLSLGYSSFAAAEAINFDASIKVTSDQKCELQTVAEGGTSWNITWNKTGLTSSFDYGTAPTNPLFIKVSSSSGSQLQCLLNTVHVGTNVSGSAEPDPDKTSVYLMPVGSSGFWRFSPVLAKIELFTDNDFTTKAEAGDLTVTDAEEKTHIQTASPEVLQSAQTVSSSLPGFSKVGAVSLTDNYLSADGFVPLAAGPGGEVSYTMETPVNIHSMKIGVGVIVAMDPEDSTGEVNKDVPVDGQTIAMPWLTTVSIS